MTQTAIKNLKKDLLEMSYVLRGNSKLTVAKYKNPLLGLVLLCFAQNRYEDAKIQIKKNSSVNLRTGENRAITKNDFATAGAIY